MTAKIFCVFDANTQIGSLLLRSKRERPQPSPLLPARGGKIVGTMGSGGRSRAPPLRVRWGLGVGERGIGLPFRAILRMKARVLNKNVEIRRLSSGRETSVVCLFGCYARRATRPRKAEGKESLVSTEPHEPTPREERYGGGGTNGVYDFVCCTCSRQRHMHRGGLLCCEGVFFSRNRKNRLKL